MAISWPRQLITDLARRRCVIFLGAGASASGTNDAGASPPGWEEFLQKAAAELKEDQRSAISALVTANDFLGAGERLKRYLGPQLLQVVQTCFTRPKFKPAPLHKAILRLDPRLVVTTNFDKIYESLANSPDEYAGSVSIKNFGDQDLVSVLRGEERAVIRLHGSAD